MDPLSDVLRVAEVTAHLSAGMSGRGRWSVAFDAPPGIKFNAVRRGRCVLRVGDEVIQLAEGDCFLLAARLPFVLATDPSMRSEPAHLVFAGVDLARVGEATGDRVELIGGRFDFGARAHELLIDRLPAVVHVASDHPDAASIRDDIAVIDAELRSSQPGAEVVAESVATAMLVRILRLEPTGATGILTGLRDPVVAAAVSAIHRDPAYRWTVAELASVASVSRSTLAIRFERSVGMGPLAYATAWRMELAAQRLRAGDETLATIAREVGYGSASALTVAFTRVIGTSPDAYRRVRAVDQAI
ncbi:AraC family transcriptional regulator [Gordonia sp. NPDC058843]|uniref:AraC family transcriptional regulator n=1 Tax=Gordonia sp. NPDC058843 TaxID=3346648 RepID=UPI0036A0C576